MPVRKNKLSFRSKLGKYPGIVIISFIFALIPLTVMLAKSTQIFFNQAAPAKPQASYLPGEVIIGLKAGLSDVDSEVPVADAQSVLSFFTELDSVYHFSTIHPLVPSSLNASSLELLPQEKYGNLYVLKFDPAGSVSDIIAALYKSEDVVYAQPNYLYQAAYIPNDPGFDQQWYLHNEGGGGYKKDADVDAPEAWDKTMGSSAVKVAVLDTGVDCSNPELTGQCLSGYDYVNDDFIPDDDSGVDDYIGHGTAVATIIAAKTNNSLGNAGMAPEIKILPVKVLDRDRSGAEDYLISGLAFAQQEKADVINLSMGRYVDDLEKEKPSLLGEAIKAAVANDIVVVAAAGNDANDAGKVLPASIAEVITVSATDKNDRYAKWSNYGSVVDLSAPGEGFFLPKADGTVDYRGIAQGTSFSAPLVSGIAALIISVSPSLTVEEVREILVSTADDLGDPGFDEYFGYGRVSAGNALGVGETAPPAGTHKACENQQCVVVPGIQPDTCSTDADCRPASSNITITTTSLPDGVITKYYTGSIKAVSADPTATLSMKVQYQAVSLPNQTKRVPIADGLPKNMRLQPCRVTPGAIECPIVGQVAFGSRNNYDVTITVTDTAGNTASSIIPLKILSR